jgi:hypothetical protein
MGFGEKLERGERIDCEAIVAVWPAQDPFV